MVEISFDKELPGVGVTINPNSLWFTPLQWMLELIHLKKVTWIAIGPFSLLYVRKGWEPHDVLAFQVFYDLWAHDNKWGVEIER